VNSETVEAARSRFMDEVSGLPRTRRPGERTPKGRTLRKWGPS
jgi:hypothetical protein